MNEHGRTADGVERWAPGSHILWRYRENGGDQIHICRPVTVVRDTAELLAVWMAPGTECVRPVLADGTPVHHEPLATRYTKPRAVVRDRWHGAGVLKLAQPGEPWSVWLFWEQGWRFKNFYVNLEEPLARWSGGVDSEDHFLDISVHPDRSWHWRDEDEFAEAQRAGLMDSGQARAVREAGRAAIEVVRDWGSPFCDGWPQWRPDPAWRRPVLPEDWDRTPARVST
ncbi:cytidylyl-2-hydroxypropylphosphonate hydrolase [Streptomyces mesophilus]|uniref:cytidylyl-2-hydroxypropylphosphonate hydrolase n=1 Tax=Streptomyces mesophilus TaxID=1775132 RepID=UPI003330DB23